MKLGVRAGLDAISRGGANPADPRGSGRLRAASRSPGPRCKPPPRVGRGGWPDRPRRAWPRACTSCPSLPPRPGAGPRAAARRATWREWSAASPASLRALDVDDHAGRPRQVGGAGRCLPPQGHGPCRPPMMDGARRPSLPRRPHPPRDRPDGVPRRAAATLGPPPCRACRPGGFRPQPGRPPGAPGAAPLRERAGPSSRPVSGRPVART